MFGFREGALTRRSIFSPQHRQIRQLIVPFLIQIRFHSFPSSSILSFYTEYAEGSGILQKTLRKIVGQKWACSGKG